MNKMKCFISLPIAGKEDTVFERAEQAKKEVESLGFEPVSPLDVNEINKENIDDHDKSVAFYMGQDIEMLINCDVIYSCKGWQNSKGCQVERKCAEVYGKIIIDQISNGNLDSEIDKIYEGLLKRYNLICENNMMNSPEISEIRKEIDRFKNDMNHWFGKTF